MKSFLRRRFREAMLSAWWPYSIKRMYLIVTLIEYLRRRYNRPEPELDQVRSHFRLTPPVASLVYPKRQARRTWHILDGEEKPRCGVIIDLLPEHLRYDDKKKLVRDVAEVFTFLDLEL